MDAKAMRRGGARTSPAPTPPLDDAEMTLLENGIDFIRAGLEVFFPRDDENDIAAHKYAIVLLFSGVLLVLKERLAREHPTLILAKVDEPAGDEAKTVDFDQILKRLKHHAKVELGKDAEALLRRTQQLRNRIEHHRVRISLRDTQALVGDLSSFIFEFMRDELGENLEEHISGTAWRRIQDLRAVARRLTAERRADLRAREQRYIGLSDQELRALADIRPYHPRHNPDPIALLCCPECGDETVAQAEIDRDIGVCTNVNCREVHGLSQCLRCNATMVGDEGFCDSCGEWVFDHS